jgi:hypothetical protein
MNKNHQNLTKHWQHKKLILINWFISLRRFCSQSIWGSSQLCPAL